MEHKDRAEAPEDDEQVDGAAGDVSADPRDEDYGPPFEARSFGGEFVWAQAPGFTAKVLRVRAGQTVAISTRGRRDMVVMLTGGRALLETRSDSNVDRVELLPATPVAILEGEQAYRLVAVTDVELFTIYAPR
ncbi:MAG: hypothetical protein H0T76_18580 [Nannocystis sp.]|nr:hypothetical protein [Nannocystis sp.]MBA3548493.1 hypothetical protein [Nannocystis sp.]